MVAGGWGGSSRRYTAIPSSGSCAAPVLGSPPSSASRVPVPHPRPPPPPPPPAPRPSVAGGAGSGIQRIRESTATETTPVAAPIETIVEPEQYVGWHWVAVAGALGQAKVTFLVRSVNGVESERTVLSREDILAPVAQVVHVGIRPKPAPLAPAEIEAIIRAAAATYGADADQLLRVAYCESRYAPLAYNGILGASGLFQIIPGTWRANSARAGLGGASVWDPVANASVAAWMFAHGQAGQWACK